jgi:23S rRNA pseudouridine955/2504/2580 synthase
VFCLDVTVQYYAAEYNINSSACHPLNTNKPNKTTVSFVEISEAQLKQRLDNFLLKVLKDVPRARIYRIIRKGEVRVNKKRARPDYKLQLGDQVRIPPIHIVERDDDNPVISSQMQDQVEKTIIYENDHILILNKAAGLAVHSGSGVSFGVIDVMRKLRPDVEMELVHRLDRDTSGCLLLAKHRPALLKMQQCLQNNTLKKSYKAVVKGRWLKQFVEICHPLRKAHLPNGERRVYVDERGKSALTRVNLIEANSIFSIIQLEIVTGRTHQIRVHCQAEGHEVVGDTKYGDSKFNRSMRKKGIKRLMLHASRLELPASDFCPEIVINAPLPGEFEKLLIDS